jgi:methyl-accepting chemotaxis protein
MIVSAIASIKGNERTKILLEEARLISEKVQAQEDSMRQEVLQLQNSKQHLTTQNILLQNRFQDFDKNLSILELDAKGLVYRANEFMLDALGYEEEAIFNESFAKLVGERAFQSTAFQHLWQNVLEGIGQNQQMTMYSHDNTPLTFWIHFVPLRNEKDFVSHIVAICTDITTIQTSLERAQTRWAAVRQIFYYIEFTPFGIIQEANQAYLKMVGRTLGQIRNYPHHILLPANSTQTPHNQEFWHELSQGKAQIGNFYHITNKGEHIQLYGVYYPVFNIQKQIDSIVFLAQPVVQAVVAA